MTPKSPDSTCIGFPRNSPKTNKLLINLLSPAMDPHSWQTGNDVTTRQPIIYPVSDGAPLKCLYIFNKSQFISEETISSQGRHCSSSIMQYQLSVDGICVYTSITV
jgi:hypothetical protein